MKKKVERILVKDVAQQCGLNAVTVRKLADEGKIPSGLDYNGWRVFSEHSVEVAD